MSANLTVTAKMTLQFIFGLERDKRITGKYCEVEECHLYGKAICATLVECVGKVRNL